MKDRFCMTKALTWAYGALTQEAWIHILWKVGHVPLTEDMLFLSTADSDFAVASYNWFDYISWASDGNQWCTHPEHGRESLKEKLRERHLHISWFTHEHARLAAVQRHNVPHPSTRLSLDHFGAIARYVMTLRYQGWEVDKKGSQIKLWPK